MGGRAARCPSGSPEPSPGGRQLSRRRRRSKPSAHLLFLSEPPDAYEHGGAHQHQLNPIVKLRRIDVGVELQDGKRQQLPPSNVPTSTTAMSLRSLAFTETRAQRSAIGVTSRTSRSKRVTQSGASAGNRASRGCFTISSAMALASLIDAASMCTEP
jgi:hypothetical protein